MAKQETKSKQSGEDKEKQHETAHKTSKPAHQDEDQHSQTKSAKAENHAETHDDLNEGEELDTLLETFEDNDLTAIGLDAATGVVDEWYDVLHKSKEPELKEIGNSLKHLKKLLTAKKTKGEDLVEVLNQLSEQTESFANNAERGYKTKLHKLGKALSKAGSFIEKELKRDDKDQDK
ncbi:MAG: hypothetical protein SFY66_10015 [Oculatellaceae cyanobacterium bins.114]|nr:hypothetical protein [Oculatellaceae cyanobacterium bins.114]